MSGLAFTPDGLHLRVSMYWYSLVLAIDGNAAVTVTYDYGDGIFGPTGSNNLAFSAAGDFFIVNHGARNILRFASDTAPGLVFADIHDGVQGRGALAFAPDGLLYYASVHTVFRFTRTGEGTVFDVLPDPGEAVSLAIDGAGRVFALSAGNGGSLYRYSSGSARSQQLLASGFLSRPIASIAVSPDEHDIYVADAARLRRIDALTGAITPIATVPWYPTFGAGIAVYKSYPADSNCDGAVNASDLQPFLLALVDPAAYTAGFRNCTAANCDVNADGFVDGLDIKRFVEILMRG